MVAERIGAVFTVAEYHDLEEHIAHGVKHEYHDGYVTAMAGGTGAHSALTMSIGSLLRIACLGTPCRVFSPDMRVQQTARDYVYPDVSVSCHPRDTDPRVTWIEHPRLVVEVLSDSTADYDRHGKFDLYAHIPDFAEYVLVDQYTRAIEVRSKDAAGASGPSGSSGASGASGPSGPSGSSGAWSARVYGPGDTFTLSTVSLTVAVDSVYEGTGV